MIDLHGNPVEVGDNVYIMAAANGGSKSMRLLYGKVTATTDGKCDVLVYENNRTYSKTSATTLRPME